MPQSAETIFRDFTTDGLPASGRHEPRKAEIREWGTWVEGFTNSVSAGGGFVFPDKATIDLVSSPPQHSMGWVVSDPIPANNGVYRKTGSGAAWTRVSDLPFSFIRASNVGAGTPNAVQATSSIPVPSADAGALIALNVFEANTGSPVTVSFNGGAALTLKTNTGNDVAAGGLAAGMIIAGYVSGSTFRVLTDQVSSAIVAAAEAAQAAAEDARDLAEGYAAGVNLPPILSGDAGKTLIVKDDETGFELGNSLAIETLTPQMFGVSANAAADQTIAMQAWLDALKVTGAEGYIPKGVYRVDGELTSDMDGLRVRCHRKAVIDASAAPTGRYSLSLSGTIGAYANITVGNAQLGATRIRTTSIFAGTLAVGDVIKIKSANVYDAANTGSLFGELNVVTGLVDAATGYVDLEYPLCATYSTSPQVAKITPITDLEWEGLRVVGAVAEQNNQKAMRIRYAKDFRIARFVGERMDDRVFWVQDSMLGEMDGVGGKDARPSSTGYGISFIDACQDIRAHHGRYSRVRHTLSTNNQSGAGGIPRRIQFEDNDVTGGAFARGGSMGPGDAIDTHGAAEDISIERNVIKGCPGQGINFECSTGVVRDNKVMDSGNNGISIHNESDMPGEVICTGNKVNRSAGLGIYFINGTRGTAAVYASGIVANNIVDGTTSDGIRIGYTTMPNKMNGVVVSGNRIRNQTGIGLYVINQRRISITGNNVDGLVGSAGIRLYDTVSFAVSGNTISLPNGATAHGIHVTATSAAASTFGVITGNTVSPQTGSITGSGVLLDNNVNQTNVAANTVRGTAGVSLGTGTGNVQSNNVT